MTLPTLVQSKATVGSLLFLDTEPVEGNLLVSQASGRVGPPGVADGWTFVATVSLESAHYLTVSYRIAAASEGINNLGTNVSVQEWSGASWGDSASISNQTISSAPWTAPSVTPTADDSIVGVAAIISGFFGMSVVPGAGIVEHADQMFTSGNSPGLWVGTLELATAAPTALTGTVSAAFPTGWGAIAYYLLPDVYVPLPGVVIT